MLPQRRGRPTLETYDVLFELARGGMGVVYAARTKDDRHATVAIKWMSEAAIEQRKHVDMFLDEMWIASCVRDEHVVEVLDAGEHEGLPFLVMEFVPGVSLLEILRGSAPPPVEVTCAILAATARGLHAAHETVDPEGAPLHIVHRDVSPHNVLVGFDGRVKVTDFGVAAARGRRTQTVSGEIKGKLSYMAPEQITREQQTDRRADVWALGVIAWEAFAGRKLFTGSDDAQRMFAVLRHPIPALEELAPSVPPAVARVVMGALTRDPEQRVPTAEAFARALDQAALSRSELAAWVRAHHGSREIALEEAFRQAERREPTVVTKVLRRPARVATDPSVDAPAPEAPTPARAKRAAPWGSIAVVVLGVAMSALALSRLVVTGDPERAEAEAAPAPIAAPALTPEETPPEETPPAPPPAVDAIPVADEAPSADVADVSPPADAPVEVERPTRGRRSSRRAHLPSAPEATEPPRVASPAPPTSAPSSGATSAPRAGTRLLDNPFAQP